MQRIIIADFELSERALDEMAMHGITPRQLRQPLTNPHRIVRNRKHRALPFCIGQDHGGSCIAAPINPTSEPTSWAPLPAWPCKPAEWALLPPLN